MQRQAEKNSVARLSVLSNLVLVVFKLLIGVLTGSVAVLSEAIHSTLDLAASIIAFLAVKASGVPADETHPYGHGKIESVSGAVEALLIFGAAGWIIMEAVQKLLHREPLGPVGWGVVIMFVSSVVNFIVSLKTDPPQVRAWWLTRTGFHEAEWECIVPHSG